MPDGFCQEEDGVLSYEGTVEQAAARLVEAGFTHKPEIGALFEG